MNPAACTATCVCPAPTALCQACCRQRITPICIACVLMHTHVHKSAKVDALLMHACTALTGGGGGNSGSTCPFATCGGDESREHWKRNNYQAKGRSREMADKVGWGGVGQLGTHGSGQVRQ